MKILCLTTFLDGRDRFEKDDARTVPDADAARFISHGWAVEAGSDAAAPVAAAPGETTLDIQNGVIAAGDSNG